MYNRVGYYIFSDWPKAIGDEGAMRCFPGTLTAVLYLFGEIFGWVSRDRCFHIPLRFARVREDEEFVRHFAVRQYAELVRVSVSRRRRGQRSPKSSGGRLS